MPAKSGVSGALILVIPNVMGIGLWSPPLDEKGNSVRGIQFCDLLVDKFNFHRFDNLLHSEKKSDPRRNIYEQKGSNVVSLLFAAQCGDTTALKRMYLKGQDLNECDYDGRTALHVSAAEGHIECVNFLVNVANVKTDVEDRYEPNFHLFYFSHTKSMFKVGIYTQGRSHSVWSRQCVRSVVSSCWRIIIHDANEGAAYPKLRCCLL